MHISQLVTLSRVVSGPSGTTKVEMLIALAEVLARDLPHCSAQKIFDLLVERERIGSTGVGKGVAIPHGRLVELSAPIAAFVHTDRGIPFESRDGKPVDLILALLSPANDHEMHLKALSCVSRLLYRESNRNCLRAATDKDALYRALVADDQLFPVPVSGDSL